MNIYGNKRHLFTIALNGFAKTDYTVTELQQKLIKTDDAMNGILNMGNERITGVGGPTTAQDATTKNYVDDTLGELKLAKAGNTLTGILAMGSNKLTDVADPTGTQDAVTKNM